VTYPHSPTSDERKSSQLLLVQTGADLVSLINLVTALEMQNARAPNVAALTTAAVRELLRYQLMPSTHVLLLIAWDGHAQTHVPYVSAAFAARDDNAQTAAVNEMLALLPRPYERALRVSSHGDPKPGLRDVIEMLCREALLEAK